MEHSASDIDAMIREEKRLTAVESHAEAWAEGLAAGIEPEIIAEAALAITFEELLKCSNEAAAIAILDRIRDRLTAGDFHAERSRH